MRDGELRGWPASPRTNRRHEIGHCLGGGGQVAFAGEAGGAARAEVVIAVVGPMPGDGRRQRQNHETSTLQTGYTGNDFSGD